MYDLKEINKLTLEYEENIKKHFKEFFKELIKGGKITIPMYSSR